MSKKMEKLAERIEREKTKLQQLEQLKKCELAREREKERKRETRAKILLGAFMLEKILSSKDERSEQFMSAVLDYVERDVDKQLIVDVVKKGQQ